MDKDIIDFFSRTYSFYLQTIRREISKFPEPYLFPDGNPVTPVLPVQIKRNGIMLIGAFPSARFEIRNGFLIPVANNLSPFAKEVYYDGKQIRTQASREYLDKCYLPQLNITEEELWITDIVKVYLYPEKHIKNCLKLFPDKTFVNTHALFSKIAKAGISYIIEEIELANPKLIITLGEIAARTLNNLERLENKELLNGEIRKIRLDRDYNIAHLAHPEIRRQNKDWDEITRKAIEKLATDIKGLF